MDEPGTAGAACPWGPSRPPAPGWMDGSTGRDRDGSIVSSMETVVLLQGLGEQGLPSLWRDAWRDALLLRGTM